MFLKTNQLVYLTNFISLGHQHNKYTYIVTMKVWAVLKSKSQWVMRRKYNWSLPHCNSASLKFIAARILSSIDWETLQGLTNLTIKFIIKQIKSGLSKWITGLSRCKDFVEFKKKVKEITWITMNNETLYRTNKSKFDSIEIGQTIIAHLLYWMDVHYAFMITDNRFLLSLHFVLSIDLVLSSYERPIS